MTLADRVVVMYLGVVVETATRTDLYERPRHPYTKALLSAVPVPDPKLERQRKRIMLEGDVPSPLDPPSGCRFRTRCWKATAECGESVPPMVTDGAGHAFACFHPEG